MASKSCGRGKEAGFECLWWSEARAGVRVVASDVNLLLVTKHLGFLISSPRCGAEGEVGRVRLKRCL